MKQNLSKLTKEELIQIIETLILKQSHLEEEIKKLSAQLSLNSSNSSMPPSTDGFKKKARNNSLREKSGKKSGGQHNHKGHTLRSVDHPDHIIDIIDDVCNHCTANLENTAPISVNTRQVFDIPLPKLEVTEYRTHNKICPHCNAKNNPKFPDTVVGSVSYGTNIQSFITYLNIQNHIPYNRITEFVKDFFQCNISEGTVYNILNRAYNLLEDVEITIKNRLINSPQVHVDETGYYVENLRKWMFTYSNENYTYYDFHEKRGKLAIDATDFIPKFSGVLTHDCWQSYDKYENCSHSLCNAHFLRELNGIMENTDFNFPQIIKNTLLEMKALIDTRNPISKEIKEHLISRYNSELSNGFEEELKENPPSIIKTGKRGKRKQSKAKNLLLRLNRIPEVLGFFIMPEIIPFDNNLAERDIRMVKVKQKVSGLHRSNQGAKQFCRIRGYISTISKNDLNIWDAIKSVFVGKPIMP